MKISQELSNKFANMSFVCACLVVLIHCYLPSPKGSAIWWFTETIGGGARWTGGLVRIAVPFFFLASGFFLAGETDRPNWWREAVMKRIRTLIIPFFFWSAVLAMLTFGFRCFLRGEIPNISLLQNAFGLELYGLPLHWPLWFVKCLFLLVLSSFLILKLNSLVFLFVTLVSWGLHECHVVNVSSVWYEIFGNCFALSGLFWFSVGMYLRHHKVRPINTSEQTVIITVAAILLMLHAYCEFRAIGLRGISLGLFFRWLSIPFAMCAIWIFVPPKRWPQWMVGNSFAIFVIHYILLVIIKRFGGDMLFGHTSCMMFLELIGLWCVALFGSIVIAESIRHFSVQTAKLIFGGR